MAGVVWSNVTVAPAAICCCDRNGGDHLAAAVHDVGLQRGTDGSRAAVLHFRLDLHGTGRARIRRQRGRRDPGAVPGDVQRIRNHDVYISIDAALKGVIARQRRKLRIPLVVQANRHHVVAGRHGGGNVDRKSVVAADVLADLLAVEVDLRLIERCLELEKHALARPGRRDGEVLPIPAVADVERGRREVGQAERMRQADVVPRGIVEGRRIRARDIGSFELPGLIEVLDKTGTIGLPCIGARRSARA
jgi:hypothetical protein